MTNRLRLLAIAAVSVMIGFATGGASARVHHHRHHTAAAAPLVCGRHHRHCHAAVTQTPTTQLVCGRHHRHCHTVAAAPRAGKVVCGRHHRHCHTVAAPSGRSHAAAATPGGEGNGTCKSVRLHGEWVQRCNFTGQGQ